MSSLLVILIGTVLVNAFLLLHRDEALGSARDGGSVANSIRIATASLVTLMLAFALALTIWALLPNVPSDALWFAYSVAVVVIAIGLHRFTRRRLPRLRRSLASSPILIVSNCLALGAILLSIMTDGEIVAALVTALMIGAAFALMLIIFVTLAARIFQREVPAPFRIAPITVVSAGLFALALMGFTGFVRI